jgi:hypothetical protein
MIRHAAFQTGSIGSLAVAVVQASFRTLLMSTVGGTALLKTGPGTAGLAAVALSPIAGTANPEHGSTAEGATESLTKNQFSMDLHPVSQAGLDKRHPFMSR